MINLSAKVKLYKELIKKQQDPFAGFIEHKHCDSLLFSGLVGCVPGVEVDITRAQETPGRWLRKPDYLGSCYNPELPHNQLSFWQRFKLAYKGYKNTKDFTVAQKLLLKHGSTISRDMLLGLAYISYYTKRLDLSEAVIKYALANWGVMGEGNESRINIMPSLFSTFCWISYKLGGPSRAWARWIPADFGGKVKGFQAHLQVLHILLRRDLTGKLPKKDYETLKNHRIREPMNPLFRIGVSDYLTALSILSDERLWPAERLPTELDRKAPWIIERDYGADWLGIKGEGKGYKASTHSGGDFLFLHWLLMKNAK